jgi:hypothetical protein
MKKLLNTVFTNNVENQKNSNARINFWCPSGMIPVNFQEIN